MMTAVLGGNAFAITKNTAVTAEFVPAQNVNLIQLAAVDLPQVLRYVLQPGDVFQGYEVVNYQNRRALRLRIFNQQTGRVRYVYVDEQTGQIL